MKIRRVERNDYPDIAAIYNYYVRNSNAAFSEKEIDVEFVDSLYSAALAGSFLVLDNGEKVVGFALLKRFLPFENFSRTASVTYFISPEYTWCGLGSLLMEELTKCAKNSQVDNFIADIASDNIQSIEFHKKQAFCVCGTFNHVGFKNNCDFSIVCMQKQLK